LLQNRLEQLGPSVHSKGGPFHQACMALMVIAACWVSGRED
jgi:hypothetical protein